MSRGFKTLHKNELQPHESVGIGWMACGEVSVSNSPSDSNADDVDTLYEDHCPLHITTVETRTHDQCGDSIEKSQAPDDGCINVRNILSTEEVK